MALENLKRKQLDKAEFEKILAINNKGFMSYLQSEYGFNQQTAMFLLQVYNRIKEKNPNAAQKEVDWMFTRALGQLSGLYNNKDIHIIGAFSWETHAWRRGAGIVYPYTEAEKYFCDKLGMDKKDYIYLRHMIRLQAFINGQPEKYSAKSLTEMYNNGKPTEEFYEWKKTHQNAVGKDLSDEEYLEEYTTLYNNMKDKGDYAHLMYTLSANLIDKGHKVDHKWCNWGAEETSWDNDDERKDVAGWLGDAVYDGDDAKVSFSQADYIADVDADNIALRYQNKAEDERLIDVMNRYYQQINIDDNADINRTQEFLNNNPYDDIEQSIFDRIDDVNGDKKRNFNDLDNDRYEETKNFLNKLKGIE